MASASNATASPEAPVDDPTAAGGMQQAPEEVVEAKLRAILDATQTSAGAVCLFDQHQDLLRLAVEIGLSDEGCRRLRNVRRGAATTWDMPLHSLLNRRAYLIESAAKNRYVPPLVDDVAAVRAVACIPLLDSGTPVGSLILVARTPFGERQIRLLEQPAKDLVAAIVAMRKRVSPTAHDAPTRPRLSAAGNAARAGDVATPGPTSGDVKVAAVGPAPSAAPAGPSAAAAPSSPVGPSSSIQAAVDRTRVELERLRARVAEAEELANRERTRAAALEEQVRETAAPNVAAQAEIARLEAVLAERTTEVQTLSERSQALEAAAAAAKAETERLQVALGEHATQAQAHAERIEALERTLEAAQATETSLRADLHRVSDAHAAQTATVDSERAAAVQGLENRLAEADAANEVLRARIADIEAGNRAAVADVERRIAAAKAEAEERLASALAEAEARTAATIDEKADWQRRAEAAQGELATARATLAGQTDQASTAALDRERYESELATGREREASLRQRITELEADIARARDEGAQLRDRLSDIESLVPGDAGASAAVPDAAPAPSTESSSTFEVVELDGSDDGDEGAALEVTDAGLDIEEVSTPAPVPEAAPAPSAPPEGIVVIDVDSAWTNVAPQKVPVAAVPPDDDVVAAVTARNPERIILNLTAPKALDALGALRAAGITTPCFACLAVPGSGRALALGRFEVASRPLDPDALIALLPGTFVRGTRVVTAGADVDALISLRQALARLGVSVSMAWDHKQASDLLAMVRPEVAIVDLDLPPKDGFVIVGRLGLVPPAPTTVLVPKATDGAAAFAAVVAHPEIAGATLPAKELLSRFAVLPLITKAQPAATKR